MSVVDTVKKEDKHIIVLKDGLGEIFMKEMSSAKMKPRPSKDIERSMRWLDKKLKELIKSNYQKIKATTPTNPSISKDDDEDEDNLY